MGAYMNRNQFRLRTLLVVVAVSATVMAVVSQWGRPTHFPQVVSRDLQKNGTFADLQSAAGGVKGVKVEVVSAADPLARTLRRHVEDDLSRNPDGWREGDAWAVCYAEGMAWDFQFRNGRLVNYDPVIMAAKRIPKPMTLLAP
jgi:hypothetical protein